MLATFDTTGAVSSTNVIGAYFGGGTVAPLQYPITGLTFGDGQLYGVYQDTDIGYPAVLASIDPGTGAVGSTSVVGQYFGGGAVAPLQFPITGLAFVDDAAGGGGSVLPEPGTWLLMLGGFGLTGALARKSRRVAPAAG